MDSWSVRDGLPERAINSIAQTPDGFIWLATDEGVIRFDGGSFKIFNTSNSIGLSDSRIQHLYVDKDGRLWYGGGGWAGFGIFNNGVFHRYGPSHNEWNLATSFYQAKDRSMWIGESGTPSLFHIVNDTVYGFDTNFIGTTTVGIGSLSNGDTYVISRFGTVKQVDNHNRFVTHPYMMDMNTFVATCHLQLSNGDTLLGTTDKGIVQIHNRKITMVTEKNGLPSSNITCLYEDRHKDIWIGTDNGIVRWNYHTFQVFNHSEGLLDNKINSILEDREGNLWIGAGSSLCRFSPTKLTPYIMMHGEEKATPTLTYSLSASHLGGVLCVTNINPFYLKENKTLYITGPFYRRFDGVVEGPDGIVWLWCSYGAMTDIIAVPAKELFRYASESEPRSNPVNGRLTNNPLLLKYHLVSINGIISATAIKGSLITTNGKYIRKIDYAGSVRKYPCFDTWVFCSAIDENANILLGSLAGLIKISQYRSEYANQGLPAGVHVLSIDTSIPGTLWLGTDKGLFRRTEGFTRGYTVANGLPSNDLFQIHTDNDGLIWSSCSYGIFSVKISDLNAFDKKLIKTIPFTIYKSAEGVRSYANGFSVAKNGDGPIWFTGSDAVIKVDPAHIIYNDQPPAIKIIEAKLDNTILSSNRVNNITPGSGELNIKYAALSYRAPEKIRYRYQLIFTPNPDALITQHWVNKWVDAGDKRYASYTNLPPGHYRFTVIGCNNDGVWNTVGDTITFVLMPRYYQTTWFACLLAIIGVYFIILVIHLRIRQVNERNQELEIKIAERTHDLNDALQNLDMQKSELESQHNELETVHKEIIERNQDLESMQEELEAQNEELKAMQESLEEANTRLAKANSRLEDLATTDGLTGLKNHRAFQEHLLAEYKKILRYGGELSLIMLDVDHFKQLNDTLGHPAGDDVLRRISRLLADNIRECDYLARYGGEEFIIVASETGKDGAVLLADRLRETIADAYWPLHPVTASFGVSTVAIDYNELIKYTADAPVNDAIAQLIDRADVSLYHSKRNGRNLVTHNNDIVEPV